jgi:hypothetical protein
MEENSMSLKRVSNKWSDLFCRVANRDDRTPRFSLIGTKGYLYSDLGCLGGHEKLDRIIKLLGEERDKVPRIRIVQPWS